MAGYLSLVRKCDADVNTQAFFIGPKAATTPLLPPDKKNE